ncbi:hypothetical protein LguiA_004464 [Lonicera macranthoides]
MLLLWSITSIEARPRVKISLDTSAADISHLDGAAAVAVVIISFALDSHLSMCCTFNSAFVGISALSSD